MQVGTAWLGFQVCIGFAQSLNDFIFPQLSLQLVSRTSSSGLATVCTSQKGASSLPRKPLPINIRTQLPVVFSQIILLGVCLASGAGGPARPSDDLSLQPLPEYTVSSDSVTMCCITASEDGRIFMGGRDGNLHELLYSTGSGWQKRCQKVTHAGGLANVLARWVVPSVFR